MTRFALIPLALLANACASAEDVQDNLTDMTYELQRDIEEMTAETDRPVDFNEVAQRLEHHLLAQLVIPAATATAD